MLFCNVCGQCLHLSDDDFIAVYRTTGWECYSCSPEDGEVLDYIEGENDSNDFLQFECPHCTNSGIILEWYGSRGEAEALRRSYEEVSRHGARLQYEAEMAKKSEWDTEENYV